MVLNRPRWLLIGLLGAALVTLALIPHGRFWIFTPLMVFGPGYLIERSLRLDLPWLARPAIWVGASLALIPLVYLWVTTAGLRVTPLLINTLAVLVAGRLVWVGWRTPPPGSGKGLGVPPSMLLLFGLVTLLTLSLIHI